MHVGRGAKHSTANEALQGRGEGGPGKSGPVLVVFSEGVARALLRGSREKRRQEHLFGTKFRRAFALVKDGLVPEHTACNSFMCKYILMKILLESTPLKG